MELRVGIVRSRVTDWGMVPFKLFPERYLEGGTEQHGQARNGKLA